MGENTLRAKGIMYDYKRSQTYSLTYVLWSEGLASQQVLISILNVHIGYRLFYKTRPCRQIDTARYPNLGFQCFNYINFDVY